MGEGEWPSGGDVGGFGGVLERARKEVELRTASRLVSLGGSRKRAKGNTAFISFFDVSSQLNSTSTVHNRDF